MVHIAMQAEDKAENATARLEEILHKTRSNWLPLWLEEHYQKVWIAQSSCQLRPSSGDHMRTSPARACAREWVACYDV